MLHPTEALLALPPMRRATEGWCAIWRPTPPVRTPPVRALPAPAPRRHVLSRDERPSVRPACAAGASFPLLARPGRCGAGGRPCRARTRGSSRARPGAPLEEADRPRSLSRVLAAPHPDNSGASRQGPLPLHPNGLGGPGKVVDERGSGALPGLARIGHHRPHLPAAHSGAELSVRGLEPRRPRTGELRRPEPAVTPARAARSASGVRRGRGRARPR